MVKKGFILGCGDTGEKHMRLTTSWTDALGMKESLVRDLGFNAEDVKVRLDVSPLQKNDASHLKPLLREFVVESKPKDDLYLFMSGHGKSGKCTLTQCEGSYNFNTPWLVRREININLTNMFDSAVLPEDEVVKVNEDKPSSFLTIESSFAVGDETYLSDSFFRELCSELPKDVTFTIFACCCFSGGLLKHLEVFRGIQKPIGSPWIECLLDWKERAIDQKPILLFASCQKSETALVRSLYMTPQTFRVYSFSSFAIEILEKAEGEVLDLELICRTQLKSKGVSFPQHPCLIYTINPGRKLFLSREYATGVVAGAIDAGPADDGDANENVIALCNDTLNGSAFCSKVIPDMMVLKQILKVGEGYECPNEGAVVKLKLIGKLQDGTVFSMKGYNDSEAELFEFKTDDEQVVDGLDRAVMTMKKGEVALLTIGAECAFGSSESQQELAVVPPYSTVHYEVELVSFVKGKESWDMNTEEKIEAASKKRAEGLELYKAKKYARASKRFEQALKFIEYDTSFSDEEKKKVRTLKLFCNFFFRECKIILNDYKDMVVNDNSSSDVLDEVYIEILKAANDAIRDDKRMYPNVEIIIDEDANSYWDMFNKTKSWILETVINLGQRMQNRGQRNIVMWDPSLSNIDRKTWTVCQQAV